MTKKNFYRYMSKSLRIDESRLEPTHNSDKQDENNNNNLLNRVHFHKISLLSNEQANIGFFGLVNMCVLLLILSNFRMLMMTISRDGILVDIFYINPFFPNYLKILLQTITSISGCLACFLYVNTLVLAIFGMISFYTEILLYRKAITETLGRALQTINLSVLLVYPIFHVNDQILDPLIASVQMCLYISILLKLYSYHEVNSWLRVEKKSFKSISTNTQSVEYPNNLTIQNLFYFLWLPTFCYETDFPKTPRIRPTFLVKRFAEILVLNGMMLAIFQQTIVPFLFKKYDHVSDNVRPRMLRTIEDIILISSPNFIMWLMFFYAMFHSTLNAWAELMYFGDREFYRDWWNACSVPYFWKNWNIPIYRFCKRHIYVPLVKKGYHKMTASTCVFLISALFHEYIASATLGIISYWAFLGMATQVPLHFVIESIHNRILKNVIFWLNLMIGQPLAITMYFREYVQINNGAYNSYEMQTNFQFSNLYGTVYRGGNLEFTSDDKLISPVGNRLSVFDLKKYESHTLLTETRKNVICVAVSPDNRLVFSVDEDGQCIVSSLYNSMPIHYFRFKWPVKVIKFSNDGKMFAAAVESRIEIYETPSLFKQFRPFNLIRKFGGFFNHCTTVEWSNDNKLLVVGSKDMSVRFFSLDNSVLEGNVILHGHKTAIIGTFFENSTNYNMYSISKDGTLIVWNYVREITDNQTNQLSGEWKRSNKQYFTGINNARVSRCEYHPQTKLLVVGFNNGVFNLYEMPSVSLLQQINISQYKIDSVSINANGEWLAFGSKTLGQLLVWEWKSESYVMKQQSHFHDVNVVTYSQDGRYLITGGQDGKVKIWNTSSGFCLVTFPDHSSAVTGITISATNQFVVTSSLDGSCRAFDLNRYRNFRTFVSLHPTQFGCVAIDGSSELVCAASTINFDIHVWSVLTGKLLDVVSTHQSVVSSLCFLPDTSELVSGSWDKHVRVWNICDSASPKLTLPLSADVVAVTARSFGNMVAVATLNGDITIWNTKKDKITGVIEGRKDLGISRKSTDRITAETSSPHKHFTCLDISPDGSYLIAGGSSKYVCLYSLSTLCLAKRFQLSKNLSMDATQEKLNSKFVTEAGPTDLLASADDSGSEEDNDSHKIKLPGVKDADKSSRKMKTEICCKSVKFSPTGRSFSAVSSEGILIYSLDSTNLFDPFYMDTHVTISSIKKLLTGKDKGTALIYAVKLNDIKIIEQVMECICIDDVDTLVESLPLFYIDKLLQHVAYFLDGHSPNIELYFNWARIILLFYGTTLKMLSPDHQGKIQNLVRTLQKPLLRHRDTTLNLCTNNLYTLRFLTSLAGSSNSVENS